MLKKIHHVGIVVPDLDRAMDFWRDLLGLTLVKTAVVQDQGVRAALLKAGESEIELLEPLVPARRSCRRDIMTRHNAHHA